MAANYSLCIGTAGWGVWHSPDGGQSWTRHRAPFPLNSRIQALAAHPTQGSTVFAGGDTGVFVSGDGGARCRVQDWPPSGLCQTPQPAVPRHRL